MPTWISVLFGCAAGAAIIAMLGVAAHTWLTFYRELKKRK